MLSDDDVLLRAYEDLYARSHDICPRCLQTYNVTQQKGPHCKRPRAQAIPSATTIMLCGVSRRTALIVRKVLDGRLEARVASPKADRWARECYNAPRERGHEMILTACDELLDGSGIESLDPPCRSTFIDDGIRMCPAYSYVNMGDTYNTTLLRDHENSRWLVSSWGEVLERHEQKCAGCRRTASWRVDWTKMPGAGGT